MKFNQM